MVSEDFQFGSQSLSDFDMIMAKPEEDQEFSTRTINRSEITSVRAKPNHYGVTYEDVLVLRFFIVKADGCNSQDGLKMTGDEIHEIRAWLESPKRPTELIVPIEEDDLQAHYFGVFTSIQPYLNQDECYGLNLEFTCDSPYGWSDKEILSYNINSSAATITAKYDNVSAEREEYIRPIITITSSDKFGADETIHIGNLSDDDRYMEINLPEDLSGIVINCEKKVVTDSDGNLLSLSDLGIVNNIVNGEYDFVSADQFSIYWFSLIPGENNIVITPSTTNTIGTLEISLRYIIKSGGF